MCGDKRYVAGTGYPWEGLSSFTNTVTIATTTVAALMMHCRGFPI